MDGTRMQGSWMEYDVIVRKNVPVPMRDGIRLTADLYMPARDGEVAGGKFPAVLERTPYDKEGKVDNPGFLDYRMPVCSDLPMLDTVMLEIPNPVHPQGVRGVGEVPLVPALAAIRNAVYNALGIRYYSLPMSPPKVLEALETREAAE